VLTRICSAAVRIGQSAMVGVEAIQTGLTLRPGAGLVLAGKKGADGASAQAFGPCLIASTLGKGNLNGYDSLQRV
jgi:hypothetical protein